MNNYLQEYEKYKDYKLPAIGEVFSHPTDTRGGGAGSKNRLPIEYKVCQYDESRGGLVETVHSAWQTWRTLHWIRKMYRRSQ